MKKGLYFLLIVVVLVAFTGTVSADELLKNPLGKDATFVGVITAIANYIAGLVAGLAVIMFVWA